MARAAVTTRSTAAGVGYPFWTPAPVFVSVMPARRPPSRTPRISPPNSSPSSRSSSLPPTSSSSSPRRASVLAYITNQLLHSQSAFCRENREQDDQPEQIIIDLPRPKRDDPLPNELPDRSGQPS